MADEFLRIRRSFLGNIALAAAVVLFLLLALEVVARIFVDNPWQMTDAELQANSRIYWTQHAFESDPVVGFRLSPDFVGRIVREGQYDTEFRTSSQSIRDREYGPKRTDVFRILAVGDSHVFGTGVEQHEPFVKRLEERLNEASPHGRVEVINAGVGGFAIDQYAGFLAYGLTTFEPDLVLVALFIGNDFYLYREDDGTLDPWQSKVDDGYRVRYWNRFDRWIRAHSTLGYFVFARIDILHGRWVNDAGDPAALVASAAPYLRRIAEQTEDAGAALGFIIVPDKRQFDSRSDPETHARLVGIHEALRRLFDAESYRYFDLTPRVAQGSVEDLYFSIDGHFVPDGHRFIAAALEPWVREMVGKRRVAIPPGAP